jgi:hypothetical protein
VQVVAHLKVLIAVNDVKGVIKNRSFDCPINLKDKYDKYAAVC